VCVCVCMHNTCMFMYVSGMNINYCNLSIKLWYLWHGLRLQYLCVCRYSSEVSM